MRWLLKPLIRPIARRKLDALYNERACITSAIARARKSKKQVSGLYEEAKRNTAACRYWEGWA